MVSFKLLSVFLLSAAAADAAHILSVPNAQDVIKDSYIVIMKDDVKASELESHVSSVQKAHMAIARRSPDSSSPNTNLTGVKSTFNIDSFKGYSGAFSHETLDKILSDEKVKYVEPNRIVRLKGSYVTQRNAPSWGLGRISHQQGGSRDYVYDDTAGQGIVIYGVDTGIDIEHRDFGGRAIWGANTVDDENYDGNGHGTHTAGTFAGTSYGVAKKATIIAVKVLNADGQGSNSAIIDGINWAVNNARDRRILGRAVMNLSLGGGRSEAVNSAANQAVRAGIFLAVAAGNDNEDASNYSPASASNVCTVGATDINDTRASFSNWGSVLKIFAPGVDIPAPVPGGGVRSMSGTSMASPHIAGLGAYIMSIEGTSPSQVCNRIREVATRSVRDSNGSTNLLAYNGSNQ